MKVAPLGRLDFVVWFGAMPDRDMIGREAFVNRELPSRFDASDREGCGFPAWFGGGSGGAERRARGARGRKLALWAGRQFRRTLA